jgi:hypothetical protein
MLVLLQDEFELSQLQQLPTLRQLTRLMVHVRGQPGGMSFSSLVSDVAEGMLRQQLQQDIATSDRQHVAKCHVQIGYPTSMKSAQHQHPPVQLC